MLLDCRDGELTKQFKSEFAQKNIVHYGVDSALFIEKSRKFDFLMEIFEKDGSESESCGNGTILIAHLLGLNHGKVEMKNNFAIVSDDSSKQAISMSMKFSDIEKVNGEQNCVFVKMGEPHIISLVDDVENFDFVRAGERLQKKYPRGVNVNAIQKVNDFSYIIRTYERGVFAETQSCGTGSLSSYLAVSCFNAGSCGEAIEFRSAGGSHWVSRNDDNLKLETLKKYCRFEAI